MGYRALFGLAPWSSTKARTASKRPNPPLDSHERRALEQLRERHRDRVFSWTPPSHGYRGGWLGVSFALADPDYQDLGLSHSVWAPTADQLAERIAAQDALAAGLRTAMSLAPSTDHDDDSLARLRAELAPLGRELLVRLLCRRAGLMSA